MAHLHSGCSVPLQNLKLKTSFLEPLNPLCFLLGRFKQIWFLSPMRAAKVQVSLRIRAVSPESLLLAYTSSESRGTFKQKARSLAPLNGWACAVKICHDGMLEDTNSLDGALFIFKFSVQMLQFWFPSSVSGPLHKTSLSHPVNYIFTLGHFFTILSTFLYDLVSVTL